MLGTAAGGEEEGTTANRVGQSCWWGALSGEVSTLSRWVSEFAGSRVGEGQYQGIGVFLAL